MGNAATCTECGETHQATKINNGSAGGLVTPKYCPECGEKTDKHPDNR